MRKAIWPALLAISGILVFQWSRPAEISTLREVQLVAPETLEAAVPIVGGARVMDADVETEGVPPLGAPDLLEVGEPMEPDAPESWAVYA